MSVHDLRPLRRTLADHPRREEIIEYLDGGFYKKAKKATADREVFSEVAQWMFDDSVATPYEHDEEIRILEYAAEIAAAEREVPEAEEWMPDDSAAITRAYELEYAAEEGL